MFFLMIQGAIWKFHAGRPKVKVMWLDKLSLDNLLVIT